MLRLFLFEPTFCRLYNHSFQPLHILRPYSYKYYSYSLIELNLHSSNILDYQNVILYRLGYIIEKENNKIEEENKEDNLENENNININENNYEEIIIEKPPINTLIL